MNRHHKRLIKVSEESSSGLKIVADRFSGLKTGPRLSHGAAAVLHCRKLCLFQRQAGEDTAGIEKQSGNHCSATSFVH